jgi:hypothetical protein
MMKTSLKYPLGEGMSRVVKQEAGAHPNQQTPPAVVAGPGVAVAVLAPLVSGPGFTRGYF